MTETKKEAGFSEPIPMAEPTTSLEQMVAIYNSYGAALDLCNATLRPVRAEVTVETNTANVRVR